MKRISWPLLITLVLTACASGETAQTDGTAIPTLSPSPTAAIPLPEDATTGARIRARGHLIVGVRYDLQPFGYVTDEGEVAGFDVGELPSGC